MRCSWIGVWVSLSGCGAFFDFDPPDGSTETDRRWAQVAVGDRATCGITDAGELWCWGAGDDGVLGIGSAPTIAGPTRVGDASDWTAVSVARSHACGLRGDGDLYCWGRNDHGELGTGPLDAIAVSPIPVAGAKWSAIDAGSFSTCGIQADGALHCWGDNAGGQLGDDTTEPADAPRRVGSASWRVVSVGHTSACGVQQDESLHCWGTNERGQIGDGTQGEVRRSPVPVAPGRTWRTVQASVLHACGIDTDGGGWCWGLNEDGRLGTGSSDSVSFVPRQVVDVPALAAIALGARHTCALAGEDWSCWGSSVRGAIAGVTARSVSTPRRMTEMAVGAVAAGGDTTCVIDLDARLRCTGANGAGQAGQPAGEVHGLERADDRTDWRAISAHRTHACGETADGMLHCWGLGTSGQLGDNTFLDRQQPVAVGAGLTNVVLNTSGSAAMRGSELLGWGVDVAGRGQFGMPASFGTNFLGVAVGEFHACGLETGGRLACAGANRYGQLGAGHFDEVTEPVVVPGTWQTIAASSVTTCGTRSETAGLLCWGIGFMVGSEATSDVATPRAVALPAAEVQQVAIGGDFACARIAGAAGAGSQIWCWGGNFYGQLGSNPRQESQVPVRVGAREDWIALDVGDAHACAIANDRTMWCWGRADHGQAGEPATLRRGVEQVGTDASWVAVAAGDQFTCALQEDGTRWCFGANVQGELGNGRSWLGELALVP